MFFKPRPSFVKPGSNLYGCTLPGSRLTIGVNETLWIISYLIEVRCLLRPIEV